MAIIDEIKTAEEKAQKIKEDAKAAARADAEMIESEAKSKAAEIKAKAADEAAARQAEAEAEAKEASEEAKVKSNEECDQLVRFGRERLKEATELILKGVYDV